jgi:RNA methyltransferase, TrmH family
LATTGIITSKDNPTFKALRALMEDARELRRQKRTLLEGPHLVDYYLQCGGQPEIMAISASAKDKPEIQGLLARAAAAKAIVFADSLFRELSSVATPAGLVAAIALPPAPMEPPAAACVVLDAIQDAGNVGTILRTAAAAGIRTVVLGPGCAGVWTPRVLRAAQGAHFGLRIHEQSDLVGFLSVGRRLCVATVASGGTSIYELDLARDITWIFGNEGAGVSSALVAAADIRATIPLAPGNESLNVGAAAAICLFEARRQQLLKRGGHG